MRNVPDLSVFYLSFASLFLQLLNKLSLHIWNKNTAKTQQQDQGA